MAEPEIDLRAINQRLISDLERGLKEKEAKDKAEKQDKSYSTAMERAKAFATNVSSLVKLCSPFSKDLKPEERQKLLEDALTGLVGSVIGEGGDELSELVHKLLDIGRGTLTDDEKRKAIEDSIRRLAGKLAKARWDKETGSKVADLTESVLTLIRLAQGGLTEKERDDILSDAAWKLMTSDLVTRQLEWFVSENFLTYAQAVKIGYDLGKPFGDYVKKTLEPIGKAKHWQDTFIALQQKDGSWIETVGASHEPVQVTAEGGSVGGSQVTAYWDVLVNDIRIQVITPSGHVTLLDKDGLDMTGEDAGPSPSDASAQKPEGYHEGDITMAAQANVERAKQIADNDPKVKALKARMDDLHAAAIATETHASDAQRGGDLAAYQDLEMRYRLQYSQYWIAREKWKKAIHDWFLKGASAEAWGTLEKSYMWRQYGMFAFEDWEVRAVMPALGSAGGIAKMPRAVSRAGIYAVIGTITLLLLGGFGFAALRGSSPTVASDATGATRATTAAAAKASAAATNASATPCDPAPDVNITVSGAATGTATKGCVPQKKITTAQTATPYCRVEGVPLPGKRKLEEAGVVVTTVSFVANGTRYDLTMNGAVTWDNSNGDFPATITRANGTGLGETSFVASGALNGTWLGTNGTYAFNGSTGTVDMDYVGTAGTIHLKGTWRVAIGCPGGR